MTGKTRTVKTAYKIFSEGLENDAHFARTTERIHDKLVATTWADIILCDLSITMKAER